MRGEVASVLIVAALVLGTGIGYFGNTTAPKTTVETMTRTYAVTTTYTVTTTLSGESGLVRCILTEYQVWMVEEIQTSSTTYGTTTLSQAAQTYETTTSARNAVGFETSTVTSYTGTLTGAIAIWNSTACTYISG